ncbi:MAG: L-threonylcarbamoyladenylate synthase, partial [Pseudomonadales bacterium]
MTSPGRWQLTKALSALDNGEVIAYPTEGVWGLGCDPFNADAVNRLLAIKHRSMDKGLILVAANLNQISPLLHLLSDEQHSRLIQSVSESATSR